MIAGVVLAAGLSRRMGAPKALLEVGGRSFLARAVGALRDGGCAEVVVVTGPTADPVAARIAAAARAEGARTVENTASASEQVDSLRAALRSLPAAAAAAAVTPVDFPRLDPAVVQALLAAFARGGARIVLPVHRGRRGHPALFSRTLFPELLRPGLPEGARSVVQEHEAEVLEVAVDEPGVLCDVDTPAEYRRLLEEER